MTSYSDLWKNVKSKYTENFLKNSGYWWGRGKKEVWEKLLEYSDDKREYVKLFYKVYPYADMYEKLSIVDTVKLTNIDTIDTIKDDIEQLTYQIARKDLLNEILVSKREKSLKRVMRGSLYQALNNDELIEGFNPISKMIEFFGINVIRDAYLHKKKFLITFVDTLDGIYADKLKKVFRSYKFPIVEEGMNGIAYDEGNNRYGVVGISDKLVTYGDYCTTYGVLAFEATNDYPLGVYITPPDLVEPVKAEQSFREGISNCFFKIIQENATRGLLKATADGCSRGTISKYNSIIKKVNKLEKQYPKGVPNDISEIQKIVNTLHVKVKICNLLGDQMCEITRTSCKSDMACVMTNTGLNHVDDIRERDFTVVDNTEIMSIADRVKQSEFGIVHDHNGNIVKVETRDAIYVRKSTKDEQFDEFIDGFKKFYIETGDTPLLDTFLKNAYIVSGTSMVNCIPGLADATVDLMEYDMIRSYTQFKSSPYYSGFPAKIHNFQKVPSDHEIHSTGIYYGELHRGTSAHIDALGYVLPGEKSRLITLCAPEILYLREHGWDFTPLVGAWGSSFDFEFPDFAFEKNESGVRRYAVFSGKLGMINNKYCRTIYGNEEWAAHLKHTYGDKIIVYQEPTLSLDEGVYMIKIVDSDTVSNHALHIASFITSYARINLLNQLEKLDISKIVKINKDAFFTYEESPKLLPIWREKEIKTVKNIHGTFLHVKSFPYDEMPEIYDEDSALPGNIHLSGPGGYGKSYWACNNTDWVHKVFVCNNYRQLVDKEEYGIDGMVVARLVGDKAERMSGFQIHPSVMILDEATKYYGSIENIMENFPYTKFIIIADIDEAGNSYQLPDINTKNKFPMEIINSSKEFTTDYRCRCDKLSKVKKLLRNLADDGASWWRIKNLVFPLLQKITQDELINKYQREDYVLISNRSCGANISEDETTIRCGEHHCNHTWDESKRSKQIEYYTNLLPYEKYMYIKGHNGVSSGTITYERPDGKENVHYEKRHAFTIHSIQGETIDTNIYIDCKKMWDSRMLYVAVSRARFIDQIYIIN